MLYRDCIEKLLQLKDVIVTNIECQGREMHIWLRMEQRMHFCPCCGTITGKVHDYRTQLVKDISISSPPLPALLPPEAAGAAALPPPLPVPDRKSVV